MEGVEPVGVAGALAVDAPGALQRFGEGGLAVRVALDLARDIADQPTEEGARLARMAHALLVAAAMQEPCGLAPGVARDAGVGLAQRHALLARQRREPLHGAQHQVAVGGPGDGPSAPSRPDKCNAFFTDDELQPGGPNDGSSSPWAGLQYQMEELSGVRALAWRPAGRDP